MIRIYIPDTSPISTWLEIHMWMKECNYPRRDVHAESLGENKGYDMCFVHEEDALAFRLKFGFGV